MTVSEIQICFPFPNWDQTGKSFIYRELNGFIKAVAGNSSKAVEYLLPKSDLRLLVRLFSVAIARELLGLKAGKNEIVASQLHQQGNRHLAILQFGSGNHAAIWFSITNPNRLCILELFPVNPLDQKTGLSSEAKVLFRADPPPQVVCEESRANGFLQKLASQCHARDLFELARELGQALGFWKEIWQQGFLITDQLTWRPHNLLARGNHLETGQAVAIKWLRNSALSLAGKFQREIDILKAVSGLPWVPALRTCGYASDRPYHICNWAPGRLLVQMREQIPDWSPQFKVSLLSAIAQVLASIHDRGIVHRDVAPDHIFIGDGPSVHLIDFGMSEWMQTLKPDDLNQYIQNDLGNFGLTACELFLPGTRFRFGSPEILKTQWQKALGQLMGLNLDEKLKAVIFRAVQANREIASADRPQLSAFASVAELNQNIESILP